MVIHHGGHMRAALAELAASHSDLVSRLILQSAVGPLPWPDRRTRLAANVAFAPATERVTWAAVHALFRVAPDAGLRFLLGDLSTRPAGQVIAALSPANRAWLIELFSHMRSGAGFANDLHPSPDATAAIRHAELVESHAGSHLIWAGDDWPAIADRIRTFLSDSSSA